MSECVCVHSYFEEEDEDDDLNSAIESLPSLFKSYWLMTSFIWSIPTLFFASFNSPLVMNPSLFLSMAYGVIVYYITK